MDLVVQAHPKMPSPLDNKYSAQHFRPAEKRITSHADLQKFLKSAALKDFMGFVLALNEAAQGQPLSVQTTASSAINSMVGVLDTLNSWVDEIPPAKQALRYGNPAYREWFAKVDDNAYSLLLTVLPSELSHAAVELKPMLLDGFGNKTRIDYGTGHETTFAQLLYCLAKLGVFTEEDCVPLVSQVFAKYLDLMRKVQTTYWYAATDRAHVLCLPFAICFSKCKDMARHTTQECLLHLVLCSGSQTVAAVTWLHAEFLCAWLGHLPSF